MSIKNSRLKSRYLFAVRVHAQTDRSPHEAQDVFFQDLLGLHSADIEIVAVGFIVQVHCFGETKQHYGGPLAVQAERTNNYGSLTWACSDHKLFLDSINFCHKDSVDPPCFPPLYCRMFSPKLITIPLVPAGTNESGIVDHSGQHL